MRQIVLDTETTGLDWRTGDRIVEIGCVELLNRKLTGNDYHVYLNPERDVGDSERIHGLSDKFLSDKAKFAAIAQAFSDYVKGAELIIHNANFDVGFLNMELDRLGLPKLNGAKGICPSIIDTVKKAKELFPGKKASLDALCERYEIDNTHRTLHGALLDAQLLAEVYLSMTRGQETLGMDAEEPITQTSSEHAIGSAERPALIVLRATEEELTEHDKSLQELDKASKGKCLWLKENAA